MQLVQQIVISKEHKDFKECHRLCFAAKNLYNYALYTVKNYYESTNNYLNYNALNKNLVENNQVDYRRLPAKVSQQVLMMLDKNYKSYFESLKSYNKTPSLFKGEPEPPEFKNKKKGRYLVTYTNQAISLKNFKNGYIKLSQSNLKVFTKIENINQVRIVPKNNQYVIEIVYEVIEKPLIVNTNYAGIDMGVGNLATIVFNNCTSNIINGKPLKSINQYYSKKLAEYQEKLPFYTNKEGKKVQKKTSNKIKSLANKRNNKVKDYLHKSSRLLVTKLQQNNTSKVVIGKNDGWKNESKMSKKSNQNFVSIPHARFIDIIKYKCQLVGIEVITREESYTSKCSFLDNEKIGKHENYAGKRIKRGMFKSKNGILINSDVNGALNILKKEIPKAFANGIEGILVYPVKLKVKY